MKYITLIAGKTSRVVINDLHIDTLKKLVEFVYTDQFDTKDADLLGLVKCFIVLIICECAKF